MRLEPIKPIGTVLRGKQDGNIRADVVIYDLNTDDGNSWCKPELEETSGVTEVVNTTMLFKRNIRYNHLAIVPRGRAGNALVLIWMVNKF